METGSGQPSSQVRRVTVYGLVVNLVLAAGKFAVGWFGASQAVIADAVHSLSDTGTDFAILVGVRYWAAPADDDHPYGHSRLETIITAAIGTVLAGAALFIAYDSITSVRVPHIQQPILIAGLGPLLSIIIKEALYRWTIKVGQQAKSSAVIANAWHHRTDAISSIPALGAVLVAVVKPEWAFVDHIGALIIAVFILKVAWDIMSPALSELSEKGATPQEQETIVAIASSVEGVIEVHKLRTRQMGPGLFIDLHILVDGEMRVCDGHAITGQVKAVLLERGPNVIDVVTHLEPYEC